VTTDCLMLDVLRSTTTTPGELCVVINLTKKMHKSSALCSDWGDCFTLFDTFQILLHLHFLIRIRTNLDLFYGNNIYTPLYTVRFINYYF